MWHVNAAGPGAWCAGGSNFAGSYIQVNFIIPTDIHSILTQGTVSNWVTTYQVETLTSRSPDVWQKSSKVYKANTDGTNVVENNSYINVKVHGIRIYPTAWTGSANRPVLRIGFKTSCPVQQTQRTAWSNRRRWRWG